MRQIVTNLYPFRELSPSIQEKALSRYGQINVEDAWWESVYEDAETVGLKIQSFDCDRHDIDGHLTMDALDVIKAIMEEHGGECETLKDAQRYLATWGELPTDGHGDKDEDAARDWEAEFEHELLEDYLLILRREYDYLTSREAVEESFEANLYEFTEDGRLA